jgi:hypothetical protein
MSLVSKKGVAAALLAAAFLSSGTQARAGLTITASFGNSITSDPNAAAIENVINQAIQVYQTKFTDNINVAIEFRSMTSGLGSSFFGFYNVNYATYRNALLADASSADDATALAHLPGGPNNPVTGNGFINVKSANLRAVGLSGAGFINGDDGLGGVYDGLIGLNTHITDVGSPGTTGQYSLLATVEHEIDEILGLGSSLSGVPFGSPFPEDLYRYDNAGHRSFTANPANAYFSIDGTTLLAQFNNANNGGDYGDWQSNPRPNGVPPQVQDAFATPGAHPTLGVNEITALDVIGYTLSSGAAVVPEPASLTLLGTGLTLLAGFGARRRQRAGVAA